MPTLPARTTTFPGRISLLPTALSVFGAGGCDHLSADELLYAAVEDDAEADPADLEPLDELAADPSIALNCVDNLALTASFANSSPGWGGGNSFTDLNDGLVAYPWWAEGLAFTGGDAGWAGQPCGVRQATMTWVAPVEIETIFVWHHGGEHIPNNAQIEVWNGAAWVVAPSMWSVRWDLDSNAPGLYGAIPTEHVLLSPTTTTQARYVTNNCGNTVHGWLYEVTAYGPCDQVCGDGEVGGTEDCDDAGESPTCDADCTTATCGDGLLNTAAGEACDDASESPTCDADCTAAACGDGLLNTAAGEACDDAVESPTCDADCTAAACGDGQVNAAAGEACDDGGESVTCDTDCTAAMCGDEVVNAMAGETCDDGGRSASCNLDCTVASCGDGYVNATAGEECDGDGQGAPGETMGCDADCTTAVCGDMVVNSSADEACDDGGASEACDDDCTVASCGDGHVNTVAGEECDGGRRGQTTECDADCTTATCGDGMLNTATGETCDDGNAEDGDGCSSSCVEEEPEGTGSSSGGQGGDSASSGEGGGSGGSGDGTEGTPASSSEGSSAAGTTDASDDTAAGASPIDDGCGCSTRGERRGLAWWLLVFIGLGARHRRMRGH
jgi:cysteine-rich repeat protein